MNLKQLHQGLLDGTITVVTKGHVLYEKVEQKLGRDIEHLEKSIADLKKDISKGILKHENPNITTENSKFLEWEEAELNGDLRVGHYVRNFEESCVFCGARMYLLLLDENTVSVVQTGVYWKVCEESGDKYNYQFKLSDVPSCKAEQIAKDKKYVSRLEFPTGKVIFQNFFKSDEIHSPKEEYYDQYSVNSFLGRDNLIQHLASKNIGYGQMGNMSTSIYTNGNEIILGRDITYIDEEIITDEEIEEGRIKYPNYYNDENMPRILKTREQALAYIKLIKDGGFKKKGEMSLSMWRWNCADVKVLKPYNEPPVGEYDDKSIKVSVSKGTWEVTHLYDFPANGDFLHTHFKLIG